MSTISAAEFALESKVLQLDRTDLTTAEVHDLLLGIATDLGTKPQVLQDNSFLWHINDRLVGVRAVRANADGGHTIELRSFDWEAMQWWQAKNADHDHAVGPSHLWTLPIAGKLTNSDPFAITTWPEFFDVFEMLDALPHCLALVPPQWRTPWLRPFPGARPYPGGFLINITGPEMASAAVTYQPDEVIVELYGESGEPESLTIPEESLRDVSVAGLLAGMTATRSLKELCFIKHNISFIRFPQGPACGDLGALAADTGEPRLVQTLDQVRQIIEDGPPARPDSQPPTPGHAAATLTAQQAVDLAFALVDNREAAPTTLASAGVEWESEEGTHGADGQLHGARIRLNSLRGPDVDIDLVAGRPDRTTAYPFAGQFNTAMQARVGEPESVSASSDGQSVRRWRVGDTAVCLSVLGASGLTMSLKWWDDMERSYA